MSDNKKVKPQNPKGTRDFLPQQVARRNFIFSTIKSVFRKYGFEEIETPALERLETLTGKYGDEGDKLLFKILNSGDYLKSLPADIDGNSQLATKYIAEKGLRYDLTVPLARYVVQHQNDIVFPFRRYHIGPVWRADKPQKGRYQEFYQCDADIIGSTSLINEIELTQIYTEVFKALGIDVTIKVNHRGLIEWIAEFFGYISPSKIVLFTAELDKIDKIGLEAVVKNIEAIDIDVPRYTSVDTTILSYFKHLLEQNVEDLRSDIVFRNSLLSQPKAIEAIEAIDRILKNTHNNVKLNLSLARGLNYYTGVIWEVSANGVQMGSIGGGGRYDNLTEMFGGQGMSGVGISFGIERIYDVMEELNLFPENIAQGVKILFVPRDASNEEYAFKLATIARSEGISAEVFLGKAKKNKHFGYAATKGIHYMVEVGDNEQQSRHFRLRNVVEHKEEGTGFSLEELMQFLKQ